MPRKATVRKPSELQAKTSLLKRQVALDVEIPARRRNAIVRDLEGAEKKLEAEAKSRAR